MKILNENLKKNEHEQINKILDLLKNVKLYLNTNDFSPDNMSISAQLNYLIELKNKIGNLNNNVSFLGCLRAKEYLESIFKEDFDLDIGEKAQGANGFDIIIETTEKKRLIAEIKTTKPYGKNRLGANQEKSIKNDLEKLVNIQSDFKFLFLTDSTTPEYVIKIIENNPKYKNIKVINLLESR